MNYSLDFSGDPIVNGERVRQAREMAGLTQSELARRVLASQAMIAHIESGLKHPSRELADAISRETNVVPASLYRPSATNLPQGSLLFRAKASVGAKDLAQARAHAERVFEIFTRLAAQFDLPVVRVRPMIGKPSSVAIEARAMMGIGSDCPIWHLTRAFEKSGGVVITMPQLPGREAFAVWAGDRPVIAVAPTRAGDRLRFSIAHEIGHLLLHLQPMSTSRAERDAHEFAAELLMPSKSLAREFATGISLDLLARLKLKWGVSVNSLVLRARDLGILSRRGYESLMRQLSARGWRLREPVQFDIPIERPRALRQMAEAVYGTKLPISQIARDFDLSADFAAYVFNRYDSHNDVTGASSAKVVDMAAFLENSRRRTR